MLKRRKDSSDIGTGDDILPPALLKHPELFPPPYERPGYDETHVYDGRIGGVFRVTETIFSDNKCSIVIIDVSHNAWQPLCPDIAPDAVEAVEEKIETEPHQADEEANWRDVAATEASIPSKNWLPGVVDLHFKFRPG